MNDNKSTQVYIGGYFLPLLAILFIGLKLTGYISWSWWWVLAPLWIMPAIFLIFLIIIMIVLTK